MTLSIILAQQEYFRDRSLFYANYPILNQAALAKKEDELETYCDKWMYLFKNMSYLRERPKVFDEKEFDPLFEMAELCNFTSDEYYNYQNSQKMIYDYENTIDFAKKQGEAKGREEGRAEGLERGREEGMAEGRMEERIEIARNMLKAGMSVEQISSLTGLSEEQVQSLIDEANG